MRRAHCQNHLPNASGVKLPWQPKQRLNLSIKYDYDYVEFHKKNVVRGHRVFVLFVHNPLDSWVFPCKNRTKQKNKNIYSTRRPKPCLTEKNQRKASLRIQGHRLFNLSYGIYEELSYGPLCQPTAKTQDDTWAVCLRDIFKVSTHTFQHVHTWQEGLVTHLIYIYRTCRLGKASSKSLSLNTV